MISSLARFLRNYDFSKLLNIQMYHMSTLAPRTGFFFVGNKIHLATVEYRAKSESYQSRSQISTYNDYVELRLLVSQAFAPLIIHRGDVLDRFVCQLSETVRFRSRLLRCCGVHLWNKYSYMSYNFSFSLSRQNIAQSLTPWSLNCSCSEKFSDRLKSKNSG